MTWTGTGRYLCAAWVGRCPWSTRDGTTDEAEEEAAVRRHGCRSRRPHRAGRASTGRGGVPAPRRAPADGPSRPSPGPRRPPRAPHHDHPPAGRHPDPHRARERRGPGTPLDRRGVHPRRRHLPGPRRAADGAEGPGERRRTGRGTAAGRLRSEGGGGDDTRDGRLPRWHPRLAGAHRHLRLADRRDGRTHPPESGRVLGLGRLHRLGRRGDGPGPVARRRTHHRPAYIPRHPRRVVRARSGKPGDDQRAGGVGRRNGRGQRRLLRPRPQGGRTGRPRRSGRVRRPPAERTGGRTPGPGRPRRRPPHRDRPAHLAGPHRHPSRLPSP